MKVLLLVLVIIPLSLFCQNDFTQSLIHKDTIGLLDNVWKYSFDTTGRYFLYGYPKNDPVIVNNGKILRNPQTGSSYGKFGEYSSFYYNDTLFIKNTKGNSVFQQKHKGKIKDYITLKSKNDLAYSVFLKDSTFYYINNDLITKIPNRTITQTTVKNGVKEENKIPYPPYDSDWCRFSNKNKIYYYKKDSLYFVNLNGKELSQNTHKQTQLGVNDLGYWIFVQGQPKSIKFPKYTYRFYINTPDTTRGPVRTVWYYYLNNRNAYYYTGDDNGKYYACVNNQLIRGYDARISNILLLDSNNYYYEYLKNGNKGYCHNHIQNDNITPLYPNISRGGLSYFSLNSDSSYYFIRTNKDSILIDKSIPFYGNHSGSILSYKENKGEFTILKNGKAIYTFDNGISPKFKHIIKLKWTSSIKSSPHINDDLIFIEAGVSTLVFYKGVLKHKLEYDINNRVWGYNKEEYYTFIMETPDLKIVFIDGQEFDLSFYDEVYFDATVYTKSHIYFWIRKGNNIYMLKKRC